MKKNISLLPYNTFGIDVKAKYLMAFHSIFELKEILTAAIYQENKSIVLGGGSNILLKEDFNGLALVNQLKGISIAEEFEDTILVKFQSGEVWHDCVIYAINNNWGGIENMSLIPGSIGAAPMQNIGAYGKELKDVFVSLEAMNIETQEIEEFSKESCEFGYRESVFKRKLKDKYIITSVTLEFTKFNHRLNSSYGAIESQLREDVIQNPTIRDISNAVIKIRQSKLPDPKQIGNAGSFFKNPVIEATQFNDLKMKFEEIPNYPAEGGNVKLAAGWLIEKAGWKGRTFGHYGVHKDQALVLVNYGGATGKEIFDLSEQIIEDVLLKFGVLLEREVNMI